LLTYPKMERALIAYASWQREAMSGRGIGFEETPWRLNFI